MPWAASRSSVFTENSQAGERYPRTAVPHPSRIALVLTSSSSSSARERPVGERCVYPWAPTSCPAATMSRTRSGCISATRPGTKNVAGSPRRSSRRRSGRPKARSLRDGDGRPIDGQIIRLPRVWLGAAARLLHRGHGPPRHGDVELELIARVEDHGIDLPPAVGRSERAGRPARGIDDAPLWLELGDADDECRADFVRAPLDLAGRPDGPVVVLRHLDLV